MPSVEAKKQLSLLTFNTFGVPFLAPDITMRYKYIAQEINHGSYDIVCLQELFSYYNFYLFKKRLSKFPYVAYHKNILGPRGGLAIFSKYPLSDQEFFTYSYPADASIPFYTKIAQNGMLSATVKDFSLRLCTTHLSSDLEHNLTPKNKLYKLIRSQSEEAARQMNAYAQTSSAVILMGDFNIGKNSELYKSFLSTTQAKDIFAKKEIKTYYSDRFKYFYTAYVPAIIDYIFIKTASKKVIPLKTEYAFNQHIEFASGKKSYLSDHIGLNCILEVNK
ncbi:MAG: endonuclease/exonuclease/phosphatase family protein [Candidatus Levyibacteriota bacterium]